MMTHINILVLLVIITIFNGAEAARRGRLIDHQLDKGFVIREYRKKDFKPYVWNLTF
jgi:hypothetical protein